MVKNFKQANPKEVALSTLPALRFGNPVLRKEAWKKAQDLAAQWRTTRNPDFKNLAASLLYDLMASEALIIIKTKRVDAKLPASLRREYTEMADEVATSVLSHNYSRFTAILEKHDPEKASLQTMVARYLHNKVVDHLRNEPLPHQFRTGIKIAPTPIQEPSCTKVSCVWDSTQQESASTLSSLNSEGAEYIRATSSRLTWETSTVSENFSSTSPLPDQNCTWDAASQLWHDMVKVLDEHESEAAWYDGAGYTAAEASAAMRISESTYKRRLSSAREKIKTYFDLPD